MLSFFTKKDFWGNGLSVWVLAALLFATPFLFSVLKTTEMNNEVEAWLPARDPQAVLLTWYNENFPVKDTFFVSWAGSSLDDPRAELLAARLEGYIDDKGIERRGSPYIEDVMTPAETLRQMVDQNIDLATAIQSLTGLLIGEGSLKVRLTPAGLEQKQQLERLIVERVRQQLGLEVTVLPAHQSWQPPAEFAPLAKIQQKRIRFEPPDADEDAESEEEVPLALPTVPEHDLQVTWHLIKTESDLTKKVQDLIKNLKVGNDSEIAVQETFFAPGSSIGLVVTLNGAGEADRSTALQDLDRIAAESFIPTGTVHVGGRPVGSAMLNEEVERAAFNPDAPWYARSVMGFSTLVSFLLAFLMVRSFRLGLLVLTVSLYATLATVALIPLSGSTMNMVLIVMPTLLSVLTLSGAIHLVGYWKHAAQHDEEMSIVNAVKMAAQPCFLASATTAIGLASLTTSTLNPVRDFGIFAAVGCGISLVFVLFVLPSLMQVWPGRPRREQETDGRMWRLLGHVVIEHSPVVILLCLGMFAFGIYGLKEFKTETKVVRYFPDDARIITDYWFLEDHVVGINTVDTIIRFDQQAQKDLDFLERLEIVRQATDRIRAHDEITGAVSLASFQRQYVKPAENARFFEKIGYNKRANELESRMKQGEVEAATSFFTMATEDTDWREPGDHLLGRQGDELWRITAQAYVMADNDYGLLMDELEEISATALRDHPGTSHSVTGMVPVFLRTQEALLESLIWSFGMAFGIIALVLMFLLKNVTAGLLTMLPNLMPVAFCFGALSMMGIRVDIGTMITASVALGIAVDGTLHLLTWFKDGIREGRSRAEAIELALAHCAPAMWQTSAIVAIGLLMLAPSSLLMISRFGILMAALIVTALLADIVFLPALLTGTLGRLIEQTEKKRMQSNGQSSGSEPADAVMDLPDPEKGTQTATDHATLNQLEHRDSDPEVELSVSSSGINGPHRASSKIGKPSEAEIRK